MSDSKTILFGVHPVFEMLKAGKRPVERLCILKGRAGGKIHEMIGLARAREIPIHFEHKPVLDRMAPSEKHQGVVAVVGVKHYDDLESLVRGARNREDPPILIMLDGVEDPRNLGSIIRTADAAGVRGVILPRHRSVGLTGAVEKAAAGALDRMPLARVTNLGRSMELLKDEGFWMVGLTPRAQDLYFNIDYKRPIALVVGGEGRGMRMGLEKKCDHLVSIPMGSHAESLNVSVAVAVVLYEAIRQRRIS